MDFSDISPDGWQNLMQFGLATMAAGGQPGATTLGSIGQGGLAAMQANRQQQLQRSQIGLQQAQTGYYGSETRQKNIATNLQLQQLNVRRWLNGMPPLDANGNDPSMTGGDLSMPGKQNAPPGAAPSGMAYAPSAGTSHQGPSASPVSNIYPAPQGGPYGQPNSQPGDVELMPGLPLSVSSGRVAPTRQQAAMLERIHSDSGNAAEAQHYWDLAYKTEPGFQLTPNYGEQYIPNSSADPRYKGAVAGAEGWAKAPADLYVARNKQMEMRGPGSVIYDPMTHTWVQVPNEVKGVDEAGAPVMHFMPLGLNFGGQQPQGGVAPQPAQPLPSGMTPGKTLTPNNGAPPVTPPNANPSVVQGLPPARLSAEEGLGKDFADRDKKAYDAANVTLQSLYQMNHDIDRLNQSGGFATPGAGNDFRMSFAKTVNGLQGAFNFKPSFNPTDVGAWEDLTKNTKRMGMQLVNQMFGGSREAASIINGATSAVPNAENTYLGARMVSSGIEQSMLRERDLYEFKASNLAANKSLVTAEADFNKANPPGMYTKRAIANAVPDPAVTALMANPDVLRADFDKKYGAGMTNFIVRGGRAGMGVGGSQ